jgi:hypothetical protein
MSKLEEALKQIKAVCEDNGKPGCEHRLALDFIWRIADAALTATPVSQANRGET